jgi:hypothetical protein
MHLHHATLIKEDLGVMLDTQFVGPLLDAGAKPAVFYFSLSAKDSLFLDPFKQPVNVLEASDFRIFSITLPGHDQLPAPIAMNYWKDEMKAGRNPLEPFIQQVCDYIGELIHKKVITRLGVMGLSRGVFIAAHVAARLAAAQTLLGFAPLSKLSYMKDWNLENLSEKLYSKTIRCYIGNHDVRVGTDNAFSWISKLADTAFEKGIRTSPIELIITPSIGKEGHGTSPEIFRAGAQWLSDQLRGSDGA